MTPTQKLIKELSKYLETEVFIETEPMYIFDTECYEEFTLYYGKSRTDMNGVAYLQKRIIVYGNKDEVSFNQTLPPKLIKLIANYYEKELYNENR
jgi:hypothetical protein